MEEFAKFNCVIHLYPVIISTPVHISSGEKF